MVDYCTWLAVINGFDKNNILVLDVYIRRDDGVRQGVWRHGEYAQIANTEARMIPPLIACAAEQVSGEEGKTHVNSLVEAQLLDSR
jgi:hypothetical protein